MITLKKILSPFNFKAATRGLSIKEKVLAALYFPSILVMWYGYYMWNIEEELN